MSYPVAREVAPDIRQLGANANESSDEHRDRELIREERELPVGSQALRTGNEEKHGQDARNENKLQRGGPVTIGPLESNEDRGSNEQGDPADREEGAAEAKYPSGEGPQGARCQVEE
jgi:hypothetical protein